MHTHRILKAIIGLIVIWSLIGLITMLLVRPDQTKAIPIGAGTGWAQLEEDGQNNILNFKAVGIQTKLIREDSILKVSSDTVTLKKDYFSPLWWVPFIAKPEDLGNLSNGECVRVVNIQRLAGKWTWLLVTRVNCPKTPLRSDTKDKDTELEMFLKDTMKNIFQFKEDVKEYLEEIERTAKELEEYEQQLEQSSDDNSSNKL